MTQPPPSGPPQQPTIIIQQAPKKKPIWLYGLIGLCAICIVPAALMQGNADDKGKSKTTSTQAGAPSEEVKPIAVTAQEVFTDFKANTVAAEEKYKGKKLLLTGTVKDIGKDIMDDPYVTFVVGGQFEIVGVQAFFTDQEESKLSSLKKGQKVTILTEFKAEIAKSVILHLSEFK